MLPSRDTQPGSSLIQRHEQVSFPSLKSAKRRSLQYSFINVDGHEVRRSTTQVYDSWCSRLLHVIGYKRWRDGEQEQEKADSHCVALYLPAELLALLHSNGFPYSSSVWRLGSRNRSVRRVQYHFGLPQAHIIKTALLPNTRIQPTALRTRSLLF